MEATTNHNIPGLSPNASITGQSSASRWSSYHEPIVRSVVNPATEQDVQVIVKHCVERKVPFLVQTGAHGWSAKLDRLSSDGLIINMRGLNSITFNHDKTQATVGGGILVHEVVDAAYDSDTQVLTGNCDTVGLLGAALGGGYGNLLGEHGFAVDQFLSMNVVLADGSLRHVTPADKDLWWAMRGTGPNFGIVTSTVVKAYPTKKAESTAFTGAIFFSEDKLGSVVDTINSLELTPQMNIYMYFVTNNGTPAIMITPFYVGSDEEARKAFAPVFALGPVMEQCGQTPYNRWNAAAGPLNAKGDRKPAYGVGLMDLKRDAWLSLYQSYKKLVADPAYVASLVICEAYSLKVAQTFEPDGPGTASSFPGRHIRFNTALIPWYKNDPSLDATAEAFGSAGRKLLRSTSNMTTPYSYVNFAFGDDTNAITYQHTTERLAKIKQQYDPNGVFRFWFPVQQKAHN